MEGSLGGYSGAGIRTEQELLLLWCSRSLRCLLKESRKACVIIGCQES
jgi:hypothetical protein